MVDRWQHFSTDMIFFLPMLVSGERLYVNTNSENEECFSLDGSQGERWGGGDEEPDALMVKPNYYHCSVCEAFLLTMLAVYMLNSIYVYILPVMY